jgi:O-antigen ligase
MRSYSPSLDWSSRIWVVLGAVCAMMLCGYLVASGRRSYEAMAVVVAAAPVLAWVALARPYLMPYGLYAALIPFDNLLSVGTTGTLTKLLGMVSGIVLILYALRQKRFNPLPVTVLMWGIYATWAAITILWALDPSSAIQGASTLAELVLLYAAISIAPLTRGDLRTVVLAGVLGALAAGGYGAWLFHHQENLEIAKAQEQLARLAIQVGNRSIDANHYADSLLFPLVGLIVWTLAAGAWWKKLGLVAGAGVIVTGIYYSASRESLLALLIALLYLLCVARRYRKQLLVVIGAMVLFASTVPDVWLRFGSSLETGGSGRTSIWHTATEAIHSYWLLGAGFDNFANAYDSVYLRGYQPYAAGWHRAAHDLLFQTIVELGIAGLILLGIALYQQFMLVSDIGPNDDLYDYRLMTQAGMIALLVAALFIDMVSYKYLWFLFATMAQIYAVSRNHARPLS